MATTRTPPTRRVKKTMPKCPPEETPTRDPKLESYEEEEDGFTGRVGEMFQLANGAMDSDPEDMQALLENSENCRRYE